MSALTPEAIVGLRSLSMENAIRFWDGLEAAGRKSNCLLSVVRQLCLVDLFYLLVRACRRVDMLHPWIYARCREVEASPNGHLDLWSRGHYKSSLITFGLTIQDILNDPETTFGIFSHTRPIAKAFLRQIMRELEANQTLHTAFPDVLWGQDVRLAPKWALDVDTPILTMNGWKRHGDLITGDRIFGAQGQVIMVTGNSGPMEDVECRRVVFDDSELVASADHLWPVQCKTRAGIKWDGAKLRIMKTDQLRRAKTMRMLATPALQPPHKKDKDKRHKDGRYLRAVEKIPSVTVNCIKVDAIDGLYLAGLSMIPTHNSEDDGIIVRRKSNPNEATIEAWGLIDGQPTSKHFKVLLYDDIVVAGSVTTPEMIEKTMTALEQSYNLASDDGVKRMAGTRWHFNDAHRTVVERGTFAKREHPGRIGGTEDGQSVYWSEAIHAEKRRDMGPHTYCLAAGMRVLMADWSWKTIEQMKTGDDVVGYEFGKKAGLRTTLVRTKVIATSSMLGKVNEYILESGSKIRCTQNHKWWSGRRGTDAHRVYAALGENGYRDLHGLVKITDVFKRDVDRMNDKVVSCNSLGEHPVFNLETETGNYIAEGYCSKNSAQVLLNPKADALQGFRREWMRNYTTISHPERMNKYLLVDAASSKKKGSDYTAIWVVGLASDSNYYALDMVRDRLNLTERADRIFALHRKWKPKQVRYEKYGLMADIEHLKSRMEAETYRFDIIEVGGQTKKEDRIGRLIPIFEQGRFYLPKSFHATDYQKVVRDLVRDFIEEEYVAFPVGLHDDMLDALARIAEPDLKLTWPQESKTEIDPPRRIQSPHANVAWMA